MISSSEAALALEVLIREDVRLHKMIDTTVAAIGLPAEVAAVVRAALFQIAMFGAAVGAEEGARRMHDAVLKAAKP